MLPTAAAPSETSAAIACALVVHVVTHDAASEASAALRHDAAEADAPHCASASARAFAAQYTWQFGVVTSSSAWMSTPSATADVRVWIVQPDGVASMPSPIATTNAPSPTSS